MSPLISNATVNGLSSGFSAIPLDLAATNGSAGPTKAGALAAGQAGGQTALFQQIQQSVLSALQSANNSGSQSDPNTVVQQAIVNVLRQNAQNPFGQSAADSDSAGSIQGFFDALGQYGVTPQQFHADYAAALKDSQNGLNPASSTSSNPNVGSLIDISI